MKKNSMILALSEIFQANDQKALDLTKRSTYKPLLKAVDKLVLVIEKEIEDFRTTYLITYALKDILVTIFFAVIQNCDTYTEIHYYAKDHLNFLKKFVSYQKAPSHDTFRRVLMHLDIRSLENTFIHYVNAAFKKARKYYTKKGELKHLSADGKFLNGSGRLHQTPREIKNIGTLNLYENRTGIVLASRTITKKDSEITVLRDTLSTFDLRRTVISADAIHTQKKTVELISQKGGHYCLGLKKNQSDFYDEIEAYFSKNFEKLKKSERNYHADMLDKNRNQIIKREHFMIPASRFYHAEDWKKIKRIVCVKKTILSTLDEHKRAVEYRYYMTSLNHIIDIKSIIRSHWEIENNLHWHLDTSMREDASLVSDRTAAINLSTIRKVCLSFLKIMQKAFPEKGTSIKSSRKRIGWNPDLNMIRLFDYLGNDELLAKLRRE
jgi:predicted transposase YbfD/YdcC